jgi:serine/threonine protein kinase/TPR repeat protein
MIDCGSPALLDYSSSAMPTIQRYHQYQLLKREDGSLWELGRGAMGITYKAFDTNLRFPVALKVINSAYLENETARQRFLREARAAAALRHPNVASVFNLGTEEDKYFYVMEFIDGETVETRVRRLGPLEPAAALNIGLQVARALAVAAKHQLVHRDLKPTNLMLVDQEGEQLVKVIDFGLAKVPKDSGEDSGALTVAGFVGTPHFASPEQIEEGEVDIRSDIYSLGVTLYFGLTGHSPFSGSIGQVMSQQLYKPLPLAPLEHLPQCVVSLLQHMMEKDPNKRPQTPQDLQKAILACIEEIQHQSFRGTSSADDAATGFETLELTTSSRQPPGVGAVLAQNYKLLEELGESPQGRSFLADDLRRNRRVNVLLLSPEFLSDRQRFANLETATRLARNSPHPLLREIYSLETVTDSTFLVQEHVTGPSMRDILRARSVLTAPEVVRLVSLLAPLADHANRHRLQHTDLTLLGVHLKERISSGTGSQTDLLRRPLTAWEPLEAKVDAINFSFLPSHTETWVSPATLTPGAPAGGPPGSCVRLLSLLAYELLGGPRARLDSTGQYTPVALLNREGNAVLRRGVVDECASADELAKQLAAVVTFKRPITPGAESARRAIPQPLPEALPEMIPAKLPETPPPEGVVGVPQRRWPKRIGWRSLLVFGLIVFAAIGAFLVFWHPQEQEIAALSISSEPAGASILLDGKPPQAPSNTFTHVPFGSHQITANLSDYEPIRQEIRVYPGMTPKIHLQLKPSQEIASLSVLSEPTGAQILLDGKPPQAPQNTFTRVPFGTHQITATLDDYEPIKQDIQVHRGMAREMRLQLKPSQDFAALSVLTEPAGAEVLLDGKPPQTPPGTFTHVPFGSHQITATLDDFEPIRQEVQVHRGMAREMRLQLKPSQEIAALSVSSEPAGAEILLDGKAPQTPPNTFTHVPFGSHQITATLDDFEPIKQDIQVHRGMAREMRLQLKPSQEIAALSVLSEPAGAEILLDGKPPQAPPNTFTHVPFGSHQITATLDDFEPIKQDIQVRRGMVREMRLQLKPSQEIATLSVLSEPAGAQILLDGKPPQSPPSTFTHVPFGSHQITATLDDFEPIKQDVQVHRGMAREMRLQLKPTQEIAALSVVSEPAGAAVLLDGKPPQTPPNIFTHVPFGSHQIMATLDDFEPIKQDVQVRRGMAREMRLQLKPSQEIAALSVLTEPAGAEILLDGKPPQSPPNTFTHVPSGSHQIAATLEGYGAVHQDIDVRRGMAPEVHLLLRQDPLAMLVNQSRKYPEGSPQQVTALVRLVQLSNSSSAPNAGEYTKELADVLERLRTKVPPIGKNEFALLYKDSVKDAASLDVVPAIVWLAENEKLSEASDLFLRAAKFGDSYAMMKLGRLYLRKGTSADDAEGFRWLNQAYTAPKPNLEAGAFIADCYLSGKGTTQDVPKAEEAVMPLANQGVVPAMTLAGRIFQYKGEMKRAEAQGNPNAQAQRKLETQANDLDRQARRWWERAEKDDWNAAAHLGKCYEEGWGGVEKNEAEAEKRYKAGASHGNALSMFFYALFLEKKPGHRSETESLMARAAGMGLPSAVKWCKDNNVPIQEQ